MNTTRSLTYSAVLLGLFGLFGCAPDTNETALLNEDFVAYHHPDEEEETEDFLARVSRVKTKKYSFRVNIRVDKDFYLAALEEVPTDRGIPGAEFRTALDLQLTIRDSVGNVRTFDPICPPIVDPSFQPRILDNVVVLTRNVTWDRLADDGELMKGWSTVDAHVSLLGEHDHDFHDGDELLVLSSTEDTFTVKLPRLNGNGNYGNGNGHDNHGNGNGYGHGNHNDD